MTLTAEDKHLDGWWAVIVVDNRDTVAPLVLHTEPAASIRAYRQGCWDPRFTPDAQYADPAQYRDNIKAWCRTAKGEERSIFIAMPAALIAAEFALPVAKCGE